MIQLSQTVVTLIAIKLENFPEGYVAGELVLNFTNQYTQKVYVYTPFAPLATSTNGRATQMYLQIPVTIPIGTYIVDFLSTADVLLATQLAYISGTDVIGEDDFKAYTTGDGEADLVYPNI